MTTQNGRIITELTERGYDLIGLKTLSDDILEFIEMVKEAMEDMEEETK